MRLPIKKLDNVNEKMEQRVKFVILGILLLTLGIICIIASALTTLVTVTFVGINLLIKSSIMVGKTIVHWEMSGKYFAIGISLASLAIGILLIMYPIMGAAYISILIGCHLIVMGLLKCAIMKPSSLVSLASIATGIYIIVAVVAEDNIWILGLLVGLDIMCTAFHYLFIGIQKPLKEEIDIIDNTILQVQQVRNI